MFKNLMGKSLLSNTRVLLALFLLLTRSTALAQDIPTSAQPERAAQPLRIPTAPSMRPGPPLAVPLPTEAPLSKEAASIRFVLKGVVIEGNTIYPQHELYWLFKKYINKQVTLADLQAIAHRITLKYRNAGYILSKAYLPPQSITNGVVLIRVVEGFVDQASVEGNAKTSKPLVQTYGNKIVKSGPLRMQTLERYVLLANDLPGLDVKAVLKPSETTPGAAHLVLVANEKHFDGNVDFNNRGTRLLGPEQYMMGVAANEMLRGGDRTEVRAAGAVPLDELQFYQIQHEEQIGTNGLRLALNADYTRSRPGDFLEDLEVDGKSQSLSAGLMMPFIRSRAENLYFDTTFKYLKSKTNILDNQLLFDDHIYSLLLGGTYENTDHLRGVNQVGFHLTQGVPLSNATEDDSPTASRTETENDFTKLNVDLSRLQAITQDISVLLAGRGQYAFDSLYSSEEFGVGSVPFGGAYDPSEIVGDHGVAGKIELRYLLPTVGRLPAAFPALQLYTYYDGGVVWNKNTDSQEEKESLTSLGLGARAHFAKYVDGYVEWARPLTRAVSIEESAGENGKEPRVFFGIGARI